MTVTAIPALAEGRSPDDAPARSLLPFVQHAAVGAAMLWWGFGLTHGTGGREGRTQTVGMVLGLVALALVRPWRVSSARSLVLAAAVGTAPVLVCLLTPTHWFGASQAATYAYSAILFVTIRAYATTSMRRTCLLAVVFGAAVAQVAWSLIAWVGGGDPSALMVGTFYWHNQFAAFLLAPAVIGAGLAAIGTGPLRLAGVLVAVLGSAGIVLSTSRTTMGLLVLGWLLAGVFAVVSAEGARARLLSGLRWLVLAGVTGVVTVVLPGPPLFSNRVAALASTAARGAQESASQNGGFRVVFWKQALAVFAHHPSTGAGFDSFGRESGRLDPNAAHSTLVHSGLLQPMSDGGLLLAAPFLLSCVLIGLALLRRFGKDAWRADGGAVSLLAIGSLLLAAHSAVDFDWTYPSLMALSAILAGIALAWAPALAEDPAEPNQPARPRTTLSLVACCALAAAAAVLAQQAVRGGWALNAPDPHPASAIVHASAQPFPGDPAS